MQRLFEDLNKRIDLVDVLSARAPTAAVVNTDTVFGELSIKLKQCYVVLADTAKELATQCKTCHKQAGPMIANSHINPADRMFLLEHALAHERVDFINAAFEHGVKELFPEAALAKRICVRKGWIAVAPVGAYQAVEPLTFRLLFNVH